MNAIKIQKYDAVAMTLHWVIFLLIAWAFYIGITHESLPKPQMMAAMGLHKSIGLTVLMHSVLRLIWRIMNPPPPLPEMSRLDVIIMKATHHLFYILIIGIPLVGWIMSSTGPFPLKYWNLFDFPKLPLAGMKAVGKLAGGAHEIMAFGGAALLLLHIAAALKHQFIVKDKLINRMLP